MRGPSGISLPRQPGDDSRGCMIRANLEAGSSSVFALTKSIHSRGSPGFWLQPWPAVEFHDGTDRWAPSRRGVRRAGPGGEKPIRDPGAGPAPGGKGDAGCKRRRHPGVTTCTNAWYNGGWRTWGTPQLRGSRFSRGCQDRASCLRRLCRCQEKGSGLQGSMALL